MLKPQDVVILAKLISKKDQPWSQHGIAYELCLSPSQINSALKRLVMAKLVTPYQLPDQPKPITQACEEFFIHGLKYVFPAKLGEMTRGIVTSYAAPSLKNEFSLGDESIPVWPYGEGQERGVALLPLYSSVPESISKHPDSLFYNLLTLLDAIRSGRARDKKIATQKLAIILKSQS